MSNCGLELQVAILQVLKGDSTLIALLGGQKIYDHVPQRVSFPYLAMGEMETRDWSTSSDQGMEIIFSLNIWSKKHGRAELYEIESRIKALLDDQALLLATQNLINLRWQNTQIERDEEARSYLAICQFRATIEMNE